MAAQFATESGDNPLWHYVIALYDRPGVKALMLSAQNDYGLDVLLLLSDCWLAAEGKGWPAENTLSDYCQWREAMVLPLRALRMTLEKPSEPLRSQLLKSELLAEQEGIRRLYTALKDAHGRQELPALDCVWVYPSSGQKKEALRPLLLQLQQLSG